MSKNPGGAKPAEEPFVIKFWNVIWTVTKIQVSIELELYDFHLIKHEHVRNIAGFNACHRRLECLLIDKNLKPLIPLSTHIVSRNVKVSVENYCVKIGYTPTTCNRIKNIEAVSRRNRVNSEKIMEIMKQHETIELMMRAIEENMGGTWVQSKLAFPQ